MRTGVSRVLFVSRRRRDTRLSLSLATKSVTPHLSLPVTRTDQHHGVTLAVGDDSVEGVVLVVRQGEGWGWRGRHACEKKV